MLAFIILFAIVAQHATAVVIAASSAVVTPSPASPGLNALFVAKGKKFWGSAADSRTLNNPANVPVLKSEFGSVTPSTPMTWSTIEPTRQTFIFTTADQVVNWAVSNGKLVRGYTLIWHSSLPSWVAAITDKTVLTGVISNHINAVAGRYKGKLYSWDVVNEALDETGALRDSVFSRVLGPSFVPLAFQLARAADPTAVLYINDYNLDYNVAKIQGMVNLVKSVNSGGKLIDGIGTEMNLMAGGAAVAQNALTSLASAGDVEIAITELDIRGAGADDYVNVTKACLAVPACVSITSWGVSDTDAVNAYYTPLLFDKNFQKKAAYYAVISALS